MRTVNHRTNISSGWQARFGIITNKVVAYCIRDCADRQERLSKEVVLFLAGLLWSGLRLVAGSAFFVVVATVIGDIEAGALEYDPDWQEHLAQLVLVTLRAALKHRIVKMLLAVELNTTIFTTIRIDWHTKPSFLLIYKNSTFKKIKSYLSRSFLIIWSTSKKLQSLDMQDN